MIEAKELRIGNYASVYGKEIIKCVGIDEHLFYYMIDSCIKSSYSLEAMQPIPLTPEILEKCGFRIDNRLQLENINTYWKDGMGEYITYHYDGFCVYENAKKLVIKSLHQLQNLYLDLTGEELNIEM